MPKHAVILSGSLGMGHAIVSEVVAASLLNLGWQTRTLDCMKMLGRHAGPAGDWVFRKLTATPGIYDSLHFAHLRAGSRLAGAMDWAATSRLVPALSAELQREPADLIVAVFATGASAAARLGESCSGPRTVVLCTDAMTHSAWARDGIDLFLVTSDAAAASVRRYVPDARIRLVPAPVRPAFCRHVSRAAARRAIGVPRGARCVLLMGGGWGLGPLEEAAGALADAGVHVLAVAGNNELLARRFEALARRAPLVHPFGFTGRIAELMIACDLVVTLPGATTCSEARMVGRRLMLLDAVPGHGRENLLHQLELGGADACSPRLPDMAACVLRALDRAGRSAPETGRTARDWEFAFASALDSLGVEAAPPPSANGDRAAPSSRQDPQAPQEAGHR